MDALGLPRQELTRTLIALALLLAAALAPAARFDSWTEPFNNPHGWVEAHHEIMALDFARAGVLRRGLLPVQNLPPQGLRPDAYNHWPPLFPIMVRWWNAVFGWSEGSARALMSLVLLAGAAGAWRMAAACGAQGWIAALVWLAVPHQVLFGLKLIHLHAALAAGMWALAFFFEQRMRLAIAFAVMATAFSWEPVPALAAAFLLVPRERRRDARWLCGAAVATFAGLMICYFSVRPDLADGLLDKIKMRTGMFSGATHDPTDHGFGNNDLASRAGSWSESLTIWWARGWESFGWVPLASLLALPFLRKAVPRTMRVAVLAWLIAWLAWFLVFQNHATKHVYQMQLGLPFFALAVAAVLSHPRVPRGAVALAVVVLLAQGTVNSRRVQIRWSEAPNEPSVHIGRTIEGLVPEGAIVMLPSYSLLPAWYMQRHLFRGVDSPVTFQQALASYRMNYPERPPLWLAYVPGASEELAPIVAPLTPEHSTEWLVLYRIEAD